MKIELIAFFICNGVEHVIYKTDKSAHVTTTEELINMFSYNRKHFVKKKCI